MLPKPPKHILPYAKACLEALCEAGLASSITLGGAFGLAYWAEYRPTHDIDAWWVEPLTQTQRKDVLRTIQQALTVFGDTRLREWGDVISIELIQEGKVVFSFQIAKRSAQITKPVAAPWPPGLYLDSLEDLIASKMVALVERGAPRDFRDIYHLCRLGLTDIEQCWELWKTRQTLARENADVARAKLAIRTHLARIERGRPLDSITDPFQREEAAKIRDWYKQAVLGDDSD